MSKRSSRFLSLILAVMLALPAGTGALADETIRGYSKASGYQYVHFGAYAADADGGKQPILWRVLRSDGNEAFLLSEYILFAALVHEDRSHYAGWEKSDLYAYLNGDFLADAFTAPEQSALLIRTADQALVTLLSGEEIKDASLGFSSNADRQSESTAWAKRARTPKRLTLEVYKGRKYSPWWTRTQSTDEPTQQRRVWEEGKIGRAPTNYADVGVRPCIHVDLSKLNVVNGSGARTSPFLLAPNEAAAAASAPAPEMGAPEDSPSPASPALAQATPAPSSPLPTSAGYAAAADPALIHEKFPALAENGFLPAGQAEFVYQDESAGLWLYASQTLRVEIHRRTGANAQNQPLRWYEARIFAQSPTERFSLHPWNAEEYTNRYALAQADAIAKKHQLVFAVNSDFFIARVGRQAEENYDYPIGVIIRNGKTLYDAPRSAHSFVYPPLDMAALYPDGRITVHENGAIRAQDMLKAGAENVLSFGPILVDQGRIHSRAGDYGASLAPRTAFGMVEPGYYIAIVVESRTKDSNGESCAWLADQMAQLGCVSAINLDGGGTSAMIFMGKQINQSEKNGYTAPRQQNELLGIGHSDAVR